MKIAIEAQRIFRKKKGGMDVVALEVIRQLQKMDKVNEYIIYVASGNDEDYSIQETENFKIKKLKSCTYADWEQIWLPLQIQKDKPDILHCTSNTAPLLGGVPKIVTVHDIIYLEKKCWPVNVNLYQRFGNYYRRFIVPLVVKNASQIITVSEFEKKNIQNHFYLDESKIKVVFNAVNESFRRVNNESILRSVKEKYKLSDKFIFFLGNSEPRKNMRNLLKAYSLLLEDNFNVPDLVITNIDDEMLSGVLSEINLPSIRSKILLTGYVDFKDLPALYTLAEFYLYPSFREGFGLPLLESMACGTAVITSSISSMPEIAADAALLVDPHRPDSIALAMKNYLDNPSLKEEKVYLGYQRSKEFTWEQSARKLLEIYTMMYEQKKSPALAVQFG